MSLSPIDGQPGLFRDNDSGQILNMRDFRPFEASFDLRRKRVTDRIRVPVGETWIVKRWSIVLHPWVEIIPPSVTLDVVVNELILVKEMPMYRVAEPLQRSLDAALVKRIEQLEAKLGIDNGVSRENARKIDQLLNQNHETIVRLNGSADALSPLFEMTKHFLVSFQGLRRNCLSYR